jgi:hypothetical protein
MGWGKVLLFDDLVERDNDSFTGILLVASPHIVPRGKMFNLFTKDELCNLEVLAASQHRTIVEPKWFSRGSTYSEIDMVLLIV